MYYAYRDSLFQSWNSCTLRYYNTFQLCINVGMTVTFGSQRIGLGPFLFLTPVTAFPIKRDQSLRNWCHVYFIPANSRYLKY